MGKAPTKYLSSHRPIQGASEAIVERIGLREQGGYSCDTRKFQRGLFQTAKKCGRRQRRLTDWTCIAERQPATLLASRILPLRNAAAGISGWSCAQRMVCLAASSGWHSQKSKGAEPRKSQRTDGAQHLFHVRGCARRSARRQHVAVSGKVPTRSAYRCHPDTAPFL